MSIVTPDAWQASLSIRFMESGSHVFCEKPFAVDYLQAAEMVAGACTWPTSPRSPVGPISVVFCGSRTFEKAPENRVGEYTLDANDSAVTRCSSDAPFRANRRGATVVALPGWRRACTPTERAFVQRMIFPPSQLIVPSPETRTDYHITIASPDPAQEPGPWRALFVLDSDDHFSIALDAYRGWWARGGARPLLLVGIGYGAGFKKPGNRRIRDYTPRVVDDEPESGGAEAFYTFLSRTLWPRVAQLYPLSDDDPGLAGHSLGGLFVLHALFRPDPFFRRGLAAAPSVWWDDEAILREVARFRAKQTALRARLFMTLGESDTESMKRVFAEFERQLAEQPFDELRLRVERFPGRGHFNVVPLAYETGLRALYG